MDSQIYSNKKLLDKIESLHKKLQAELLENSYVSSLENYCTILRNSIIYGKLELPNTTSFQFYFSKLKDRGNIDYLFSLLHECWILANPNLLFDSELKDYNQEVLLDMSLSEYSNNVNSNNYNSQSNIEDYNSPKNIIIANAFYREISKRKSNSVYLEYLKELRAIIINIFKDRKISLTESFMPFEYLQVSLNREQLDNLFETLSSDKNNYLKNDKETKQTFLAIFANSLLVGSKKIQWMDLNPKNNMPSISSLYTLFDALNVKMDSRNKSIICHFFNDAKNNPISPESLKSRNESENLRNIRNIVNSIYNNLSFASKV